jgi:hypothetical protein
MKSKTILHSLLLLLACLLAVGCGDPDRARIVGIWVIKQPDSLMGRLNLDAAEEAAQTASRPSDDSGAATTVGMENPKMQIEFRGNGTFSTITQMGWVSPQPKQGRWEMLGFDETKNEMQIQCIIGLQETEHDVEFIDSNTIKLVPPNMAGVKLKITFTRQE